MEQAQRELVDQAQRADMASVATDTLHNVGNILTSINTTATMLNRLLRDSKLPGLGKTNQLLDRHRDCLSTLFETEPKGQKILDYLQLLDSHLNRERHQLLEQVGLLHDQLRLVTDLITAQQQYARSDHMPETLALDALIDTALLLCGIKTDRYGLTLRIQSVTRPRSGPRTKVIHTRQFNPKRTGCYGRVGRRQATLTITVEQDVDMPIRVADNGCGIRPDRVDRLFEHGFTTKPNGHGFGLHSCANDVAEMGGRIWAESDGEGLGATFTLSLPLTGHKDHSRSSTP